MAQPPCHHQHHPPSLPHMQPQMVSMASPKCPHQISHLEKPQQGISLAVVLVMTRLAFEKREGLVVMHLGLGLNATTVKHTSLVLIQMPCAPRKS